MLKNLDESRDRRCPDHDKDLNSGHDGTTHREVTTAIIRGLLANH